MRGAAPLPTLLVALALAGLPLALAAGCDRNVEPFDPDEPVREPDLSKIFPEGAERAEPVVPSLPPVPGEGRGAPPLASEVAEAGAEAPPIQGRVEVAPELANQVPGGAILFIIARRAAAGPPLAVKRIADPTFPLAFELGPADRMIQQLPWEGPLTLSARLDQDANATSRSEGDLQGEAKGPPIHPGATDALITLDQRL